MQCHEMFAEIVDHFVRDVRQFQNRASQCVLGKSNAPSKTSRNIHTKFSDHSA